MDPASITSLISFAKDAIEIVDKMYELLKAIRAAPKKLQRLLDEVRVLRDVLDSVANACGQIKDAKEEVSVSVGKSCWEALNFIKTQADDLYTELHKYKPSKSTGRWRTWQMSLDMVVGDKKIVEQFGALERGKSLLMMAQASLQLHILTRQTRQIDFSTQKLDESIKLNSAIANYCSMQLKAKESPHDDTCLGTSQTTSITLPRNKRNDDPASYSSMRQELAELKLAVSTLMAPPLRSAHIDPQPLGPLYDQIVYQFLNAGKTKVSQDSYGSSLTTMTSRQIQSRNTVQSSSSPCRRLGPMIDMEYARNRFSDKHSVYLASWFGTIAVTRKWTSSKKLNHEEGDLGDADTQHTTSIQFTPASWLTKTAWVLSLQRELAFAASPNISLALQPVRYVQIPSVASHAIYQGDLMTLQHLLRAGQVSLHDREWSSGYSLLELSFGALNSLWLMTEYAPPHPHVRDIVQTARWIFARGTSADTQCQDVLLPNFFSTASLRENDMCNVDDIEQMEQLLIEVSENEPAVHRCQRLLAFAVWNPDHSLYVDCVISDIAQGDFTEQDLLSVSAAEEDYWAKGSLVASGLEASILYALLKLRAEYRHYHPNNVPRNMVRDVLKGPRRILFDMLKVSLELPPEAGIDRTSRAREIIDYTSSYLRICRDLPLLEDGFGDLLSAYAHEHHMKDVWNAIISRSTGYSDGIELELLRLDLDSSIALFIRGDSENRLLELKSPAEAPENALSSAPPTLTSYIVAFLLLILRSLL